MEACGASLGGGVRGFAGATGGTMSEGHVLTGLGRDAKLIAPEAAKPFVEKGRKNEAVAPFV